MENEKFYSTKESAEYLHVSERTFQRYREAGIVTPDMFGSNNTVFYRKSQLVKVVTTFLPSGDTSIQVVTQVESLGQIIHNFKEKGGEDMEIDVNDNDIIIVNEQFLTKLPMEHQNNLTKLFSKLTVAPVGEIFATPFNSEKTLITYAKLDYVRSGLTFDRKLDEVDKLILNSIYSFYRAGNVLFTSRNVLQHIFGNVADHFQSELVEVVERYLDELKYMRFSMDLKDKYGNDASIKLHGEKYRPIALEENLLDVSILSMKSVKNSRIVKVYRINKLSPIFQYSEKLKQLTSWQTVLMRVPVRKTLQNALLCNYLLVKISLIKNSSNHYKNNGILFQTIFDDLKLDVNTRDKKKNIRDNIRRMFDYWLKVGLIQAYKFEKKDQKFYKISFSVAPTQTFGEVKYIE